MYNTKYMYKVHKTLTKSFGGLMIPNAHITNYNIRAPQGQDPPGSRLIWFASSFFLCRAPKRQNFSLSMQCHPLSRSFLLRWPFDEAGGFWPGINVREIRFVLYCMYSTLYPQCFLFLSNNKILCRVVLFSSHH